MTIRPKQVEKYDQRVEIYSYKTDLTISTHAMYGATYHADHARAEIKLIRHRIELLDGILGEF